MLLLATMLTYRSGRNIKKFLFQGLVKLAFQAAEEYKWDRVIF
jgi:hypothetical protein